MSHERGDFASICWGILPVLCEVGNRAKAARKRQRHIIPRNAIASQSDMANEVLSHRQFCRAAINDFRILITQACQESPITLLGFIPEYFGERTPQGNVKKYIRDRVCDISNQTRQYSHTPDAVFSLEKDGNPALFFLEVDRGTEIISNTEKGLLKSIVFYLNYWVDGKYQRYQADFGGQQFKSFRTLLVTTSDERLQNIREAVTSLPFTPAHVKRFLWGTASVSKELLFSSIWQSLDATDSTLYKIG